METTSLTAGKSAQIPMLGLFSSSYPIRSPRYDMPMHILETTKPDGRSLTVYSSQQIAPESQAPGPFFAPASLEDAA
jgi:hypothetical protein